MQRHSIEQKNRLHRSLLAALDLLDTLGREPDRWEEECLSYALSAMTRDLYLVAELYFRIRHEEGLGMGDVKMLAMVGAFLGWELTIMTLVLGSIARATGFSLVRFLRYIAEEILVVLGTSSSESALPRIMAKLSAWWNSEAPGRSVIGCLLALTSHGST